MASTYLSPINLYKFHCFNRVMVCSMSRAPTVVSMLAVKFYSGSKTSADGGTLLERHLLYRFKAYLIKISILRKIIFVAVAAVV